jgi:hypothetical protein
LPERRQKPAGRQSTGTQTIRHQEWRSAFGRILKALPGTASRQHRERPFVGENYLAARLEALSGLTFWAVEATVVFTWVARLQFPFFHFASGSGQEVQYHLAAYSDLRLQPSHCSTISWQNPSL